ncbi:MAG: 5-formyltetrahydrofolate cyclo-ligase [Clostridium sp.]|jgi:5-formyltetrahydrofolate cyclo-ligase|uniref:5-formyltetrahydrofolate cyclo-ligase n=1 Tax=Clostridium sp. TaxID=1506 RepID=UPI0025E66995|nr:5-formyltetrahydrofolate cyclo-ligase [Clostridium sp.]MCI6691697.1 5-formyltetrahydrofolate cyclo-ligase [Clostridium sp.]MDY4253660.1 5-formyltetrahydrofolate cyclo-ligase [Clostridium sp.]MDY6226771.1 5-formyltetrahydrofolate cyclo-ligase [Clostridium sp.]
MNKEEKKILRNKILIIRNSLDKEVKEAMDDEIYNKLITSDLYIKAKNIFIYLSFGSEIQTNNIITKALRDEKEVYIPKVYKKNKLMKAVRLKSFNDLKENSMGILEPIDDSNYIDKREIDLILVPGVVFDLNGNRIGYGGGYYDRYLQDIKEIRNKVVLAYDLQIVDSINPDIHDIAFDYIITNTRLEKIIKNS